jgi:SnoaL-like domain
LNARRHSHRLGQIADDRPAVGRARDQGQLGRPDVGHGHCHDLLAPVGDRVRLDYTSLQGGEPTELTPEQIVSGWQQTLGALDAHQHLVANHLVDVVGGRASATAAFQATHQFDGATWTLGGDYAFELRLTDSRWRIESMTMTAVWQTGDRQLLDRAGQAQR